MAERVGAGSLGPRLAGRLTSELILRSPQYMNCVKEYQIDLRGNKVAAIENLGATENQFDCIDLSDNAIVRLEDFPKLPRLKTLLLNHNRLMRIGRHLEEVIPNLEVLILTNNRITNLSDLDPLSTLSKLKCLSLLDNPVTTQKHYRLYTIVKCKRLKVLDFRKVKQKEREEAEKLFGGEEAAVNTFEPDEELAEAEAAVLQQQAEADTQAEVHKGFTPDQATALRAAIANAQTLEEMQELESALRSGHMPSQMVLEDRPAANGGPSDMEEG